MEYNIENHLIFLNGGSNEIWFLFELEPGPRGDEVLKVMPRELEDLMMSSTTELSSCCVLVSTCPELVFYCSFVVRHVLEAVLDHNNFLVVPSITKGVVLVKLPNKSDAACLIIVFMCGKTTLLGSPRLTRDFDVIIWHGETSVLCV
mgnify:CR=1 FL=1